MRLALFEPDIPQNAGTILRFAACLGLGADIIEPCGFLLSDRHFRRAGMDYLAAVDLAQHASWADFLAAQAGRRLILLTTAGDTPYHQAAYCADDILLVGRESSGVPDHVHARADLRVHIPMPGPKRGPAAMPGPVRLPGRAREPLPGRMHDPMSDPESLRPPADRRPRATGLRSLNVAVAAAMVAGEALRQTAGLEADALETDSLETDALETGDGAC